MKKRGRPKLRELPTRQFILEAAMLLFQKEGFKRVSIEKICQRAGVSKMSFYRSFSDKFELLISMLIPFFEEELAWSKALLESKISFRTKLNELFRRRQQNLASPFIRLCLEVHPFANPLLSTFFEKEQERVDALNLSFFKLGQKEGVISKKIKPEIFLFLIQRRNELILDPALVAIAPGYEERFSIVNEFFYFGLKGDHREM